MSSNKFYDFVVRVQIWPYLAKNWIFAKFEEFPAKLDVLFSIDFFTYSGIMHRKIFSKFSY